MVNIKKIIGYVLIAVGIIFVILAAKYIIINRLLLEYRKQEIATKKDLYLLHQTSSQTESENQTNDGNFESLFYTRLSDSDLLKYGIQGDTLEVPQSKLYQKEQYHLLIEKREQEEKANQIVYLDTLIGFVEIDKLGISLPIYPGTTDYELAMGVGIVESTDIPSAEPSSISVLAGHRGGRNMEQTFYRIDRLETGDEIRVLIGTEQLVYRVTQSIIIADNDWSHFTRIETPRLMLMSCHPYPTNEERYLVISEFESKTNLGDL